MLTRLAFSLVRLANKAPRGGYWFARVAARVVPGLRNYPIPTRYGRIVCDLRESVCWPLVRHGEYPHWREEEAILPKLGIDSDTVVLDVGANLGITVLQYAKMARHVHAFEPAPRALRFLRQNVSHLPNVTIHAVALGDRSGTTHFAEEQRLDLSHLAADGGIEVPITTVDALGLNPDFIKIDVEGFEHLVLAGARNTLMRGPTIFFEALEAEALQKSASILKECNSSYSIERIGRDGTNYIAQTR